MEQAREIDREHNLVDDDSTEEAEVHEDPEIEQIIVGLNDNIFPTDYEDVFDVDDLGDAPIFQFDESRSNLYTTTHSNEESILSKHIPSDSSYPVPIPVHVKDIIRKQRHDLMQIIINHILYLLNFDKSNIRLSFDSSYIFEIFNEFFSKNIKYNQEFEFIRDKTFINSVTTDFPQDGVVAVNSISKRCGVFCNDIFNLFRVISGESPDYDLLLNPNNHSFMGELVGVSVTCNRIKKTNKL